MRSLIVAFGFAQILGVGSALAGIHDDDGASHVSCSADYDRCSLEQTIEACKQYAWTHSRCSKERIIDQCSHTSGALEEVRGERFGEVFYKFSKSEATRCSDAHPWD